MSVPFSNTHLRVPRGFGTILEGLAREVLRDQPEDIPKYAAEHFEALLKQREESGLDPAEWAAKLEDRFYNNHAFKVSVTLYRNTHYCHFYGLYTQPHYFLSFRHPFISSINQVVRSHGRKQKKNKTKLIHIYYFIYTFKKEWEEVYFI
uniref:Sperm autoantigenic protein 17 n=1 Tax=Sphaeramia orbicularis TaxID=375764 RepID=A0A673A7K4_9TELE